MPLKPPVHNLEGVSDIIEQPEETENNALGLTWDIQTDTLQPIYHYHLKGKIDGVNKIHEIVGLLPQQVNELIDNMTISRTVLAKITPQSFDISGPFLGPLKSSLKIMLSRACDITSLAEKDLDLNTRDAKLVTDVKTLIKEIAKLKLNPWTRCLIPAKNKLWKILVAVDGSTMASSAMIYFLSKAMDS